MVRTSPKPKLFRCNSPGCPVRHKLFTKNDLDRHSGTHLPPRLKPFHCTLCDKHYVQKCGFERHTLEIHGHLEYSCQFCPTRFQKYDMRRAHLKKVHDIIGRGKNSGNGEDVGGVAPLSTSLASAVSPVLEAFSPAPSLSWESESSFSSGTTSFPWDVSASDTMANIVNPLFVDRPLPLGSSNLNLPKMPNPDEGHLTHLSVPFPPSQTISTSPGTSSQPFDVVPSQAVVVPLAQFTTPNPRFLGEYPAPPTHPSSLEPFPWPPSVSVNGASTSATDRASVDPWLAYQHFIMSILPSNQYYPSFTS